MLQFLIEARRRASNGDWDLDQSDVVAANCGLVVDSKLVPVRHLDHGTAVGRHEHRPIPRLSIIRVERMVLNDLGRRYHRQVDREALVLGPAMRR